MGVKLGENESDSDEDDEAPPSLVPISAAAAAAAAKAAKGKVRLHVMWSKTITLSSYHELCPGRPVPLQSRAPVSQARVAGRGASLPVRCDASMKRNVRLRVGMHLTGAAAFYSECFRA